MDQFINRLKSDDKFWRKLTNVWTFITFAVVIYDVFTNNGVHEILAPLFTIYISILIIYAGQKEFERWHDFYSGRHPGEIFAIAWTILLVVIIATDTILDRAYQLPESIISVYISVLGILAITQKSKSLFKDKHPEKIAKVD